MRSGINTEKTTEKHGAPGETNQLPKHAVTKMPLCIQTGTHAAMRPSVQSGGLGWSRRSLGRGLT